MIPSEEMSRFAVVFRVKILNSKNNKRPIRKSPMKEKISPTDFRRLKIAFTCEDCSYYFQGDQVCTLGLNPELHKKNLQLKSYNLSGKVHFCRFLEVD